MAELVARRLSAGYRGRAVIHELELSFGPGVHLMLGPNGAGKTTTFRALSGVLAPIEGEVLIDGADPAADVAAKAAIGVCTHRTPVAGRLTVADNLRYWALIAGMPRDTVEQRIETVLGVLNLTELAGRRAAVLSRGQTQRLGLAKAFLPDPPILLLDEPTSGVDPINAAALLDHLRTLAADGRTVIASSHTLSEAVELADDVTVLHRGRVVGAGPADRLREELVGTAYRVRLRGTEGLGPALAASGRAAGPTADGRGYVVEVGSEQDTEKLIADLVRAGVGLRECVAADNPLEDVYRQLLGREGADDTPDSQA